MTSILLLFVMGLFLSAFFSGSETGFYRVPRVRLLIDALGGSVLARCLLWLTNYPSLFVATTLIGNNLANYITSLAIVLLVAQLLPGGGAAAEVVAPIIFAPILFTYGEMFPKNLFFQAPYRLLRAAAPAFMVFTVLFFPISVLLWAFSYLLELALGSSPQKVQLTLARKELREVLEEGHEAGVLRPAQRQLAQGLFSVANQKVRDFLVPLGRFVRVSSTSTRLEALKLARKHKLANLPVEDAKNPPRLVGYVNVAELMLQGGTELAPIRPLMAIPENETHIAALMMMQADEDILAQLVNRQGRPLGIINADDLRKPLMGSSR